MVKNDPRPSVVTTQSDDLTRSLRQSQPRLADDLRFSPLMHRGKTVYHIEATADQKFYRVGSAEYVFLSLLDGQTTFSEALAITAQQLGPDSLSETQAKEVMKWLMDHGLVEGQGIAAKKETERTLLSRINPIVNKIPLGNPDALLDVAKSAIGWLFHPAVVTIGLLLIFCSGILLIEHFDRFVASSKEVISPGNWGWLALTWAVLKVIHEVGHGVACKRFGGSVNEAGVLMILFAPLAYVDVTSSWRFASKWRRIGVALAGMYFELLVAALAMFGWVFAESPLVEHLLYNVIITATVSTLLFNANPLMRFDGYFVLSDLLGAPNLHSEGREAFGSWCKWLFFGTHRTTEMSELTGKSRVVSTYGFLAAGWQVLITTSIAITAAAMFHKVGLLFVLLAGVAVAWKFCGQAGEALLWHWRHRPASCLRAGAVAASVLGLVLAAWFVMPNPVSLVAPGIVDFDDASIVRSETSGFITQVDVSNGQWVEAGQPLVKLENRELTFECAELESEIASARTKESIALDEGDVAAAQVAARDRQALTHRLRDKTRQRDGLVVVSPIAGHVVARELTQKIGTFLDVGEEILSIGNESKKEMILSLQADEIDAAQKRVGSRVRIRLGSNRVIGAQLDRIEPRATLELPHDALAATEGGPLAVRESDESEKKQFELVKPRFVAIAEFDAAEAKGLACGQRGYARLGTRGETFGRWVFTAARRWVGDKMDVVAER